MNLRSAYPAGIGVFLTLLTLSAAGQQTAGASVAPSKTATANTAASDAAGKSDTKSTSGTHKHHVKAHHNEHARRQSTTAASTGNQETAYRAALRNCVAGPAAQRDSCLDNSIARFGRS